MCFSATASFVAGAGLLGGGALVLATHRFPKRAMLLASIPLIFGLHQLIEGVVWLGIDGVLSRQTQDIAMHVYTFIAMCVWPVMIPLAMLVYERPNKRYLYRSLLVLGTVISVYLLWGFTLYSELTLEVRCNEFAGCSSIMYFYRIPYLLGIIDGFYVAVVILPFLLSSNKRIRYVLAPGFLFTFLLALYMQVGGDYPSIWCFLAALLSISIYSVLGWSPLKSFTSVSKARILSR